MTDAIDRPGDEVGHVVDPPIVDHLYYDPPRVAYVITFIPDDYVSPNEKEVVVVPRDSEDGRRIGIRLQELQRVIGRPVERLFHKGGGNFGFHLNGGDLFEVAEDTGSNVVRRDVYVQLQDLGMIAQIAFRETQLLQAGRG